MASYTVHVRVTRDYEASFEADNEDDLETLIGQLDPGDFDEDDETSSSLEVLYIQED